LIAARWLEVVWRGVLRAVVEGLWLGLAGWTEGGEIEMGKGEMSWYRLLRSKYDTSMLYIRIRYAYET
jgi:hypothetical protein